jgi:hypothetical protein
MPVHHVDLTTTRLTPPSGPSAPGSPVWVEVRSGLRRIHVLAGDILAALGKRRDLAGKGRNESEDVHHAIAWLRAHGAEHLVVTEAQRLHPIILNKLIELTNTAEVTLWLLHRPPRSDAFVRSLGRRGAAPAVLHQVPSPEAAQPEHLVVAEPLPAVPPNDFVTFRAACHERLPADDAARVDAHFQATLDRGTRALRDAGAAPDTIADLVHVLVNAAPTDPELTIGLRAVQVAAWHHGLFIQIDLPRILNSQERPHMTSAEVDRRAAAYRQPYRPITIALTRAGHGVADIAEIPIADASVDGTVIRVNDTTERLSPDAARAVRAQLRLRHADGADETNPLLPHTPKALAKVLTQAAIDLGIHVHGRRAERTRDRTRSKLRALGITVTDLR